MTGLSPASSIGGAGDAGPPPIPRSLAFAASPVFVMMAVLNMYVSDSPMDLLCSAGHGTVLGGMVPMYLLMSVFHLAPWLKLIARPWFGPSADRSSAPRSSGACWRSPPRSPAARDPACR